MKFKEYKENYLYKFKEDDVFIGYFISSPLSYLLNCLFYSEKLIPNYITFAMMLTGIFSGILFSIHNMPFMITGYFIMHLWYAFDAWDGAVARQSKKFSKYGKEFDYVAHLVSNPVLIFSIANHQKNNYVFYVCLVYLILDVIKRGLYMLDFSRNHLYENDAKTEHKVSFLGMVCQFFTSEPDFILIAPVFVFFNIPIIYYISFFILFETRQIFVYMKHYLGIYLKNGYDEKK